MPGHLPSVVSSDRCFCSIKKTKVLRAKASSELQFMKQDGNVRTKEL